MPLWENLVRQFQFAKVARTASRMGWAVVGKQVEVRSDGKSQKERERERERESLRETDRHREQARETETDAAVRQLRGCSVDVSQTIDLDSHKPTAGC